MPAAVTGVAGCRPAVQPASPLYFASMRSFIAELKRRNVLRVAAAYALVAWIIIEAGSVLLPTFGAGQRVFQAYVIVVIAGFVMALVAAWVFELTPEGVKLDKHVDRSIPRSDAAKQSFNFAIIGLLIVALAVSITFNVTDLRGGWKSDDAGPAAMRRSIAVLPFASLSNDPDNVSFVDGIHDDLLTKLASIGSLKVISRTSVLEYRNTNKNLKQIGEELGVDTILEGTVQRFGDNVRVNVQLIDAQSDDHLWAQTYDRQLTMQNIFSIQSEISEAISGALQATLLPHERTPATDIPTQNIRAYGLYVSGRQNLYLRRLETLQEARVQLEQAIALDPDYAEAYVALAESVLLLYINHNAIPREEAFAIAQSNLDRAFALNSELADAYATLGLLKTEQWSRTRLGTENTEAEVAFEYAISLNPNHAQAYMWFASLRDDEQRYEDAIALYHRSMQLDPLGRIPYSNLPTLYAQQGQNDVAIKLWHDAIEIHPEWPTPYAYIATHLLGMGRLDEALAWNVKARELSTDPAYSINVAVGTYVAFGDLEMAREVLMSVPETNSFGQFRTGFVRYLDGDNAGALEFLAARIDSSETVPPYVINFAGDIAIMAGELDKAREYILKVHPILESDTKLQIDRFTVRDVIKLAYIDLQHGNTVRGRELLNAALPVVQSLPRLGMFGQGIRDAQVYALLGRKEDALAAFQVAADAGIRSSMPYDPWYFETDPFLASIRDDARFTRLVDNLDSLIEPMRSRAADAAASGNWAALRALSGST